MGEEQETTWAGTRRRRGLGLGDDVGWEQETTWAGSRRRRGLWHGRITASRLGSEDARNSDLR